MTYKNFIAWVAGLWEGEGCIAHFKSGRLRVEIIQTVSENKTTEAAMKLIQSYFKGRIQKTIPKIKHYLPQIKWVINNHTDMLYFLNSIAPYCQFRKQFVLNSIKEINDKEYKHYRTYIPYLKKIRMYLKRNNRYIDISKKLKKFINISPSTICRIVKQHDLRNRATRS